MLPKLQSYTISTCTDIRIRDHISGVKAFTQRKFPLPYRFLAEPHVQLQLNVSMNFLLVTEHLIPLMYCVPRNNDLEQLEYFHAQR